MILKNIDSQILLLGLASNYREYNFSFYKNKAVYASIFNGELVCKHENYKCGNDIEIFLDDSQLNNPLAKCTRMSLDKNTIQELNKLASNMLVPESELSREKGAGAGNIDND